VFLYFLLWQLQVGPTCDYKRRPVPRRAAATGLLGVVESVGVTAEDLILQTASLVSTSTVAVGKNGHSVLEPNTPKRQRG
jgi:hypothetical protein